MIGFYPPTLGSLRTDILEKIGELEGASLEERAKANVGYVWNAEEDGSAENIMALERTDNSMAQTVVANERKASRIDEDPRNALDF
jgi:allophanate hydrolase subunit 2